MALPAVGADQGRFIGEAVVDADVVVGTMLGLQLDVVVAVEIEMTKVKTNPVAGTTCLGNGERGKTRCRSKHAVQVQIPLFKHAWDSVRYEFLYYLDVQFQ